MLQPAGCMLYVQSDVERVYEDMEWDITSGNLYAHDPEAEGKLFRAGENPFGVMTEREAIVRDFGSRIWRRMFVRTKVPA